MEIKEYTKERIQDVVDYELRLRKEEPDWGWEIDETYIERVTKSFDDIAFNNSLSLLAYDNGIVIGRIDSTMICSHFDGSTKAYLDWICVLPSYRHKGVAQHLMSALREKLKNRGATDLVGIIAHNKEALSFYHALENVIIRDEGIWITL